MNYVQYFQTLSNTFFQGGEKFSKGVSPPLFTGLATSTQISNSSLLFKRVAATDVTALCKKQTTPEDRIVSDTNYFHRIQTKIKFANVSNEPHYAVAERHLIFLHICKMVLQNNR